MTFPDFDSLPRTRNTNYNIHNIQHFFTFLAPRNLNRRTLELFSCSTSGWASKRLVGVLGAQARNTVTINLD